MSWIWHLCRPRSNRSSAAASRLYRRLSLSEESTACPLHSILRKVCCRGASSTFSAWLWKIQVAQAHRCYVVYSCRFVCCKSRSLCVCSGYPVSDEDWRVLPEPLKSETLTCRRVPESDKWSCSTWLRMVIWGFVPSGNTSEILIKPLCRNANSSISCNSQVSLYNLYTLKLTDA